MVDVKALSILVLLLSIDLMLALGQHSIEAIQPEIESSNTFFNYQGSLLETRNKNNYTINMNEAENLPSTDSSVSGGNSGNIFTDTYNAVKGFFKSVGVGADIMLHMLNAPFSLLINIGLPVVFAYYIGMFWHLITLLALIVFLRGG